jgi:cation-transporting P-type ATPase E
MEFQRRFQQRQTLINEAVDCHFEGRFAACITLVLAQIDGLTRGLVGTSFFPSRLGETDHDYTDDSTLAGIEGNLPVVRQAFSEPDPLVGRYGQAGVPEGRTAVDARTLQEDTPEFAAAVADHTAFGRVSPTQKRAMVHALQGDGRVVAMTGDGVNDVLALKDGDVGVAMGSGSPAARAVSRIVLLDNSFATLPHIVAEGRRVIGNIERVATLFLTKTLYSALLALFAVIVAVPYPFLPRHVTLIAWFTIGIPAFFLALAPNTARAQDGFVRRVLSEAIPGGIGAAFASFGAYLTARAVFGVEEATRVMNSSTAFLALITVAFFVLVMVARPFRWWKSLLVACMIGGMLLVILTPLGSSLFDIDLRDWRAVTIALGFGLGGIGVRVIVRRITRRFMLKRE